MLFMLLRRLKLQINRILPFRGFSVLLLLVLIIGLAGCMGNHEDQLVAEVNHETLSLDELVLMFPGFTELDSLQKSLLVESWIKETLLAQEAEKNLMHRDPGFKYRVETYRRRLLADKQLDAVLKDQGNVTQAEVEAYYRNNRASFRRQGNEFFGFHVLLPTRDEMVAFTV